MNRFVVDRLQDTLILLSEDEQQRFTVQEWNEVSRFDLPPHFVQYQSTCGNSNLARLTNNKFLWIGVVKAYILTVL